MADVAPAAAEPRDSLAGNGNACPRNGRDPAWSSFDDEVDAFLEQLTVESAGLDVIGELLRASATHPSGDQASASK